MMEELVGGTFGLLCWGLVILSFIAMWKVFVKAGREGWMALIPILNLYTLLQIAGKPGWWLILFFIPVVNFITAILVSLAMAKKFGHSDLFGLGLAFFPYIFYFILGFGESRYQA